MFRVSRLLALSGLTDSWWFTVAGCERGHVVHYISEQVFTTQPVTTAPSYAGYEVALRNAYHALLLRPICVERRLTHDDVTGRPDVIGWLPERVGQLWPGPVVLDVKSGERYPSHAIQLGFYGGLADATPDLRDSLPPEFRGLPWQRVGLYVRPTGRFTLHPYLDPQDLSVCAAILDLTRWRVAHGLLTPDLLATQNDDSVFPLETIDAINRPDGPRDDSRPTESDRSAIPAAGA